MGLRIKTSSGETEEVYVLDLSNPGDLSFTHGVAGPTFDPVLKVALPGATTPERFGAVGDGATDDTAALESWIASGNALALKPGKTYMHRRRLNVAFAGTIINGNGATLKRVAQTSATTTTTVTSGVTTQITLTGSTMPFQRNDQIVVSQGGGAGAFSAYRQISAINGQTITVDAAFNVSLSGTTNVYLAGAQIYVPAAYDNCRISDLVLDGNVSNWTLKNWSVAIGVYVDANTNTLVDHVRVKNSPGDGFETNNSTNAVFFACVGENIAARGLSFGGSGSDIGNKAIYCRFFNCETDVNGYKSYGGTGANDGHGSINFSLGGNDALIHGCQIDTGITAIGGGDNAAQNGVTISSNVIRNMSLAAIEGINSSNPAIRYEIIGNRIYNAVRLNLNQSSAFTGAVEWEISDNLFVETDLFINNYQQVGVRGNRFYSTGTVLTFITMDNAGGAVGVQNSTVIGNRFYGGANAIVCGQFCSGLVISNNVCSNQLTAGINTGLATDVLVSDNYIVSGAATTTSTNAITANGSGMIRGNLINFNATGNSGVRLSGSASKMRVIGNTITTQAATNGLQIAAGAADCELRDNNCNTTYSDAGTRTVKTGNRINYAQAMAGRATLVAGTVTVSTAEVLTGDNVQLTNVLAGGTLGTLSVGTIVNKTSFVINSSNVADTSTVYWRIDH